ncbi:MAG: tRNA-dihydrouridine synthase [Pirellulales bacterium]|nr:tRNA-dihydrouridine synthase [Pirellulales bacterium]
MDASLSEPRTPSPPALWLGSLRVEPPLLMAPMAGFTNFAFRRIARQYGGVGLPATEMVSARSLLEMDARRRGDPARLWGVRDEPRPLAVQIWDNDPGRLAEVARRIARDYRASVVDLNFGCPVPDVSKKAESGAYLLEYPERIGAIVARVVGAAAPTPVTAKIRLGPTAERITAGDVAQAVEEAGAAGLVVHGRTAGQMYRGRADWERIADVKSRLRRIPLVGNGDLRSADDVVRAFRDFGVDGAMIGRAALGRPWLFRQAAAALAGEPIPPDPTPAELRGLLLEHHRLVVQQHGPRKGTILMRTFAGRYGAGLPDVHRFRASLARATTPEEFTAAVNEWFAPPPAGSNGGTV